MSVTYSFLPYEPIMIVRVTGVVTTEEGKTVFRETMKYLEETGAHHLYRIGDISQLNMSEEDFEKAIHQAVETYRNKGGATDSRIVPISVVGNRQSIAFVNEIKRRSNLDYPVFHSIKEALAYVRALVLPQRR